MQKYDITLKLLFQSRPARALRDLTGKEIAHWLNVEFPRFHMPRVDLLGETTDGELLQIELQSMNDPAMALRMAEYRLAIYRRHKRFPRQIVVYVGPKPMAMSCELPGLVGFRYELVDMREVDGDRLLASPHVSDNVIGILGRLTDSHQSLQRLVQRIARLKPSRRAMYVDALMVVAGLRGLEPLAEREVKRVPVIIDILENKVLGREYKRGLEEGIEKGRKRGIKAGKEEGQLLVLRQQLEYRFGTLPTWAEERLKEASAGELKTWAIELLHARSLKKLLS